MARYELISKQHGAIWLRIIFKTPPTAQRHIKIKQNKDYAQDNWFVSGIERFNNLDKEKEISLFHLNNKFISNELKNLSQKVFA